MEQNDPLTGEKFTPRRTNQKFASRENQVRHNNLKAAEKRKAKSVVDKILDNNRSILKKVLAKNTEIVRSKEYLLGAGFHFGCVTHTIRRDTLQWTCVYEYAFMSIGNNSFKIIKHA